MSLECDFTTFAICTAWKRRSRCGQGSSYFEGDEADALYIVSRGTLRIASGSTVYEVIQAGDICWRDGNGGSGYTPERFGNRGYLCRASQSRCIRFFDAD